MVPSLGIAAAVLGTACGLLAQKPVPPGSAVVTGRVADQDDRPVAGARVLFVGMQTGIATFEADDTVTVATDARGCFVAPVLPRLPYFAIAVRDEAAGGAFAAPAVGWFGAGAHVELRGEDVARWPSVRLEGLEAWKGVAAPRPFARAGGLDRMQLLPHALDWPETRSGAAHWPALPFGALEFENEFGATLWSKPVVGHREPTFMLPAPRSVRCVVKDEMGAPVADAELWLRGATWTDGLVDGVTTHRVPRLGFLARTGADGIATVTLAAGTGRELPDALLVARAEGHVESVSGRSLHDVYCNDLGVPNPGAQKEHVLDFTLPSRKRLQGRLRGSLANEPADAVVLRATCKLFRHPTSYSHDLRIYSPPIDGDGRFDLDWVPDAVHSVQWIVRRGPTSPPLLFGTGRELEREPSLDLAQPSSLTLSVLAVDGGPAGGRAVYLQRVGEPTVSDYDQRLRTVVDSGGRTRIDVVPGRWVVRCFDDAGSATVEIDAAAKANRTVQLELRPHARVRGAVVDGENRPIAGARFEVRNEGRTHHEDLLLDGWSAFAVRRTTSRTRSAADGSFEVLLPMCVTHRFVYFAGSGERRSADFEPQEGETLRVVVQ